MRDVIPDFREPDGVRIGLSPLSTSFLEVRRGLYAVRDELERIGMTRTNPHGQPIGEPVPDWAPRLPPAHTTLAGRYVALEPVAAAHAPALYAALAAEEDDASWTYRHDERPTDEAGMLRAGRGLVEPAARRHVRDRAGRHRHAPPGSPR